MDSLNFTPTKLKQTQEKIYNSKCSTQILENPFESTTIMKMKIQLIYCLYLFAQISKCYNMEFDVLTIVYNKIYDTR